MPHQSAGQSTDEQRKDQNSSTPPRDVDAEVRMRKLSAILGGLLGFLICFTVSWLLESYVVVHSYPMRSYGQQFGMLTLPICVMIGAAIGGSIAVSQAGQHIKSCLILALTTYFGWQSTVPLWISQIQRYGSQPQDILLYHVPLVYTAVALIAAVIIGLIGIIQLYRRYREVRKTPYQADLPE